MTDIQKENKSGGKVPNLRFPEFEGEWKVKKLGEVALQRLSYARISGQARKPLLGRFTKAYMMQQGIWT